MLKTVNLGDSGYMLLRRNGMDLVKMFRTKEQQHQFNFPYQVGTGGDDPAKGDEFEHEVEHNDIIVLATDGLFDNLFDVKIIELLQPFVRDRAEILDHQLVAEIIAKEAERWSHNMDYVSPFGKAAHDYFYDYRGGKPDDITVIVGQVQLRQRQGVKLDGDVIE